MSAVSDSHTQSPAFCGEWAYRPTLKISTVYLTNGKIVGQLLAEQPFYICEGRMADPEPLARVPKLRVYQGGRHLFAVEVAQDAGASSFEDAFDVASFYFILALPLTSRPTFIS